jgi:hypothetical protein
MKKKQVQIDARQNSIAVPPDDEGNICPRERDGNAAGVRADAGLAKRCLSGEVLAWEQFYAQCHEPLLTSVRVMLGPQSADANLVDEIAARVWYALVAADGALLARYKPDRGARLITFMRALAKDEMVRYFRAEIRRRKRELASQRERPEQQDEDAGQLLRSMTEFFSTLTSHERVFCGDYLLTEPSTDVEQKYSKANIWQLSRRIRCKLLHFLDPGS